MTRSLREEAYGSRVVAHRFAPGDPRLQHDVRETNLAINVRLNAVMPTVLSSYELFEKAAQEVVPVLVDRDIWANLGYAGTATFDVITHRWVTVVLSSLDEWCIANHHDRATLPAFLAALFQLYEPASFEALYALDGRNGIVRALTKSVRNRAFRDAEAAHFRHARFPSRRTPGTPSF